MIQCEGLTQTYLSGGRELVVLKGITFDLEAGGFLAIVGPSGSGKSTLRGLLAGLDRPKAGRVRLDGQDLAALDEDARARLRGEKVGFVFQSFHLIPTLTARENVQVPLELRGETAGDRAEELLARVGLGDRGHHYPAQSPAASSSIEDVSEPQDYRYRIPEKCMQEGEQLARTKELAIVGSVHSHVDQPARPAVYDRDQAEPNFTYVIVGVRQGRAHELAAWKLSADGTAFFQEDIRSS